MKVKDLEKGWKEIYIESTDDLWYLKNLIDRESIVAKTVMRREERSDDMERSKEIPRKPVMVELKPEKVFFQPYTDNLRVQGIIVSGSEDLQGQHQSMQISAKESVELFRENWQSLSGHILKEALLRNASECIFIVMDDENALLAELHDYGIREMMRVPSGKMGKAYQTGYSKIGYFQEIRKALESIKYSGNAIITGPGFEGPDFYLYMKENAMPGVTFHQIPSTREDVGAIYEIIAADEVRKILGDSRLSREKKFMDAFLEGLGKHKLVSYGLGIVATAANMGAVSELMVVEEKISDVEVVNLMDEVMNSGGTVNICSDSSNYHDMVSSFGGILALLRYDI